MAGSYKNVYFTRSRDTGTIQVTMSGRAKPVMSVPEGTSWADFLQLLLAKGYGKGATIQFMGRKDKLFSGAPKNGAAHRLGDWIDGNLNVNSYASSYQ